MDRRSVRTLCGSREPERGTAVIRPGLFRRVVLTTDLPGEGLKAGDLGVVVEHHAGRTDMPDAYELEFFSVTGETLAVVSVPVASVREPTGKDVICVRALERTLAAGPPKPAHRA